METENWQIEYHMRTPDGVVHPIKEQLPCKKGYHKKLIEWYRQNNIVDVQPIYKLRGNYIELLSLGLEGGRDLPLEQRAELKDGDVLYNESHPVILIAPNGERYRYRET